MLHLTARSSLAAGDLRSWWYARLWRATGVADASERVCQQLQYLFEGLHVRVDLGGRVSEYVRSSKELPQGLVLCPTIFAMIHTIMMHLANARIRATLGGPAGYFFNKAQRRYDHFLGEGWVSILWGCSSMSDVTAPYY